MGLDTAATEISQKLEKLAFDIGKDFLSARGKKGGVINLYGHEPEILDFIKERMEQYFKDAGKQVVVLVGKEEGYAVDVGYFTSRIFAQ